jgi:maltose O-acetyltransferase
MRRTNPRYRFRVIHWMLLPVTRLGLMCGFTNVDYSHVYGPISRLHIGERCGLGNTTFNVSSGDIYIGDHTLISTNCSITTGQHRFYKGRLVRLQSDSPYPEVPMEGRDIHIGSGCFLGANAVVLGGVTIGENVIIGAGAVVTKDIPSGSFATGIPARVVKPS